MALICPYCRTAVSPEAGDGKFCDGCGTPHHHECLEENGGCTLFGCKFAPSDDPKLQITMADALHGGLSGVGIVPTPANAVAAPARASAAARAAFGDVYAVSFAPPVDLNAPPPPPPPVAALAANAETAAAPAAYAPAAGTVFAAAGPQPKARLTYILLGILLGVFGVHNFYAGFIKRGLVQLGLTLLTFFYASVIVWIWAVVEVCTVESDNRNINFV